MSDGLPPPILPPVIAPPVIGQRAPVPAGVPLGTVLGAAGLTPQELREAVERGGRFVVFQYCVSVLVLSFKRSSPVYFIKPGESAVGKGLPYCLISVIAGWWGIPWGPIWTLTALANNISGGRDVTSALLSAFHLSAPAGPLPVAPPLSPDEVAREDRKTTIMRLAWAMVALLFLGMVWFGFKVYQVGQRTPSAPGEAEFRSANARIGRQETGDSGNTTAAIELAGQLSKAISLARALSFEQAKEKSILDERDQFKTYCDLRADQCVFLIHVPELRRFSGEAQQSLGTMAWLSAQHLLEKTGTGKPDMRLAVGLRGIAAYDRVLTGQYTPEATDTNTGISDVYNGLGCERHLRPWFAP